MEPVAMHLSGAECVSDSKSQCPASTSRPQSPLARDIPATFAEGTNLGPSSSEDRADENDRASDQEDVAQSIESRAEEQSSRERLPSPDQIPKSASTEVAAEPRQALASSETKIENDVGGASTHESNQDAERVTSAKIGNKADELGRDPDSISGHLPGAQGLRLDAASPASSSEDAPGSDYEDFTDDHQTHEHSPPTEPQMEPGVEQSVLYRMPLQTVSDNSDLAKRAGSRGGSLEGKGDVDIAASETKPQDLEVAQSTPIWLSELAAPPVSQQQASSCEPDSNGTEPADKEGTSLKISDLLDQIGESATASDQEGQAGQTLDERLEARSPAPPHYCEEAPHSSEPASLGALVRQTEQDGDASPAKRIKLDDATSRLDESKSFENDQVPSIQGVATSKKTTAKQAKSKAATKPKKETKARGKKSAGEGPEPSEAIDRSAQPIFDPALNSDTVSQAKDVTMGPEQASEASMLPATPLGGSDLLKTATLPTLDTSTQTSTIPDALPGTPAPPSEASALTGKAKAKPRSKATSKAKAKAKGETSVPSKAHENVPAVEATVAPRRVPPLKPTSARSKAKKGKGPVAKLLPAQTDEAVSELELEPPQHQTNSGPPGLNSQAPSTFQHVPLMGQGQCSGQGERSTLDEQHATCDAQVSQQAGSGAFTNPSIFSSMPPPMYPARAYYPTRAHQAPQQQASGLNSLTNAATLLDAETRWSESTVGRSGSPTSSYEGVNEPTSPTVHTSGSVAGDSFHDASNHPERPVMSGPEINPLFIPPGWRYPNFDVIDPDALMTTLRERTVWTFWDCYFPLGCRDQDLVIMSNDGVAFPCAAWNPCIFSSTLKRIIQNPSPEIRQILSRGPEQNRKVIGYQPVPCIMVDETWHATNFLLSFLHPIPTIFLPDRLTCRLVYEVGMRYGVERAIQAASHRISQIEEEDKSAAAKTDKGRSKGKGKARGSEDDIARDLAEKAAAGGRG